jgi:hypothetical protein
MEEVNPVDVWPYVIDVIIELDGHSGWWVIGSGWWMMGDGEVLSE